MIECVCVCVGGWAGGCVCVSLEGQRGPQVSMFICLCHHPPPQHVGELQPQQQNTVSAKKYYSSYVHVHLRGAFIPREWENRVALTHERMLQLGWSVVLLKQSFPNRCRATNGLFSEPSNYRRWHDFTTFTGFPICSHLFLIKLAMWWRGWILYSWCWG